MIEGGEEGPQAVWKGKLSAIVEGDWTEKRKFASVS